MSTCECIPGPEGLSLPQAAALLIVSSFCDMEWGKAASLAFFGALAMADYVSDFIVMLQHGLGTGISRAPDGLGCEAWVVIGFYRALWKV